VYVGDVFSDNNQLHFGAIVCMLGTRYKSYCSNIVRTLLVEPTAEMQANYDLLLQVEEQILSKLQHGLSLTITTLVRISPEVKTDSMQQRTQLSLPRTQLSWLRSHLLKPRTRHLFLFYFAFL